MARALRRAPNNMFRIVRWITTTVRAITILVVLCSSSAQAQTLSDTVAQFYPQSLIDLGEQIDAPAIRYQCFGVLEADSSGVARTVLAAYTDRSLAVVRVLRDNGNGFAVVDEPAGFDFYGSDCTITVTNLNNDINPDALLTFNGGANTVDWTLSWNGQTQTLTNLSPTTATSLGTFLTKFRNAQLLDLNNDGIPEITSWTDQSPDEPLLPTEVYKWVSDHYELDQQIVGPWVFHPVSSSYTHSIPFDIPPGAQGPYTLKVVNGTSAPNSRVADAIVRLNRRLIVTSADLNLKVASVERAVTPLTTPLSTNVLEVRVGGTTSRQITIFIQAAGWTTP